MIWTALNLATIILNGLTAAAAFMATGGASTWYFATTLGAVALIALGEPPPVRREEPAS